MTKQISTFFAALILPASLMLIGINDASARFRLVCSGFLRPTAKLTRKTRVA